MKMLCLVITFFAFATSVAAQTKTCADIATCGQIAASFGDSPNSQDPAAMCEMMKSSKKCMEEALADCRRTGMMTEDQLNGIQSQTAEGLQQAEVMCKNLEMAGEGGMRSCMEINSCQYDTARFKEAENRQDYASMCKMMKSSMTCMEEAMADCRKTGLMTEDQLNAFQSQTAEGLQQAEEMCKNLEMAGEGGMRSCMEIASCQYDTAEFKEAENRQDYALMCKMLQDSSKCMNEALEDCRRTGLIPKDQIDTIQSEAGAAMQEAAQMCEAVKQVDGQGQEVVINEEKGDPGDETSKDTKLRYETEAAMPTAPKCMDMLKCISGMTEVLQLAQEEKTEEACKILKPIVKCTEVALHDCEKQGLGDPQLEQGKSNLENASKMLKEHCGTGGSGVVKYSFLTLVLSSLLLMLPRMMFA